MRFKVHKLGTEVATMWAEPSITVRDAHRKHCNGPAQLTAVNLPSAPGTEQCQTHVNSGSDPKNSLSNSLIPVF